MDSDLIGVTPWSPDSWQTKSVAQATAYEDPAELQSALVKLRSLPPLVTSWEIERLKEMLAQAQEGRRFLLQGGDCAETLIDCRPDVISNKLKILLQMSLVLVQALKKPVIRVGRFAGQYAKPRSSKVETREVNGEPNTVRTLPSYYGDLINRPAFDADARRPDPALLVDAYMHSAMTLNFIRSLAEGGFADLHHPEYWDLSFFEHADLSDELRHKYLRSSSQLSEALRFMEALGETSIDELTRVEFYASHEGLNLHYESAQTREVPRRHGFYDLTTHLPWIGERTRGLEDAHVEFFRGIRNPVGVKVGPTASADDIIKLIERLNPTDEAGKIVLIVRMGASKIAEGLPPILNGVQRSGRRVLWVSDPMHGNTITAANLKTRDFDDIVKEIEISCDVHAAEGTYFGGVHFELTGDDVTECLGGAAGLRPEDLSQNYATLCDPRLNYRQSIEMAFRIAEKLKFASG